MDIAEYKRLATKPKGAKYRNQRTETPDGVFDSSGEAKRWAVLKLLEQRGLITDLQRQVAFPFSYNGIAICTYRADFTYDYQSQCIVEDFKGVKTEAFRIKAKMMKAFHGINIKLVSTSNADIRPD